MGLRNSKWLPNNVKLLGSDEPLVFTWEHTFACPRCQNHVPCVALGPFRHKLALCSYCPTYAFAGWGVETGSWIYRCLACHGAKHYATDQAFKYKPSPSSWAPDDEGESLIWGYYNLPTFESQCKQCQEKAKRQKHHKLVVKYKKNYEKIVQKAMQRLETDTLI